MTEKFVVEKGAVAPFVSFQDTPREGDGENRVDHIVPPPMHRPEAVADDIPVSEMRNQGRQDDDEGEGNADAEEVCRSRVPG